MAVSDPTMLLKTGEFRVSTDQTTNAPKWSLNVTVEDSRDTDSIKRYDAKIIDMLQKQSNDIFGEPYTIAEIMDIFVPSLDADNGIVLQCNDLFDTEPTDAETDAVITTTRTNFFTVYDPSKTIIGNERLAPGVVFKCALRPWTIEFNLRIMRIRVLWIVDHCMILEEPFFTECVLEADDNSDNDHEK